MKKVLVIDIDDVLVDSYMFIMLNKFLGTNYKEEDFSDYYLEDAIKDPKKLDEYYNFIFTQDMYKDIPIKEGVQEVLPKLNEKYDLLLCTDFLIPNYEWQADKEFISKFNMLREKFSYLNPKQFIFMRRKQLLHADIMIDDKPTNFGKHIKQKLMLTAYHNKKIDDRELKEKNINRVNSWFEIAELLL